jgi:hypothetical protein
MAINFPLSPSTDDLYTYLTTTWKWNGNAWEKSAATETGNVEGNTGEISYYYEKGSNIRGATAFFYDDTNNRIGIGTSVPTETLDVRGGITASGALYADQGATFGGSIYLPTQYAAIGPAGGQIQFNKTGNQIVLHEEVVDILQTLRHYADPDTYLKFTTDDVAIHAGGNRFLHGTSTYVDLAGVTFGAGGATFGGDIIITGGGGITCGDDLTVGATNLILSPVTTLKAEVADNLKLYMSGSDTTFNYDTSSGHTFKVRGPSGLHPIFANDSGVGINVGSGGPQELFHVAGGMSAGGATFAEVTVRGGITAGGTLYAAQGITSGGHIGLQNNDYISNPSAYNVRMMPKGTSDADYGLNFDFSSWGHGVIVDTVKASDDSGGKNIRFDAAVVINDDTNLTFGSTSHSRIRHTSTGNNTLQIGVKSTDTVDDCSGSLALIHSSHFGLASRSPGVTHDNPNLYVYSFDAGSTKYIRFEHDGTDANIVTGAGDISLQPAGGIACGDNEVSRPKFKDYSETALATSSKSASFNVDFESGNVQSFTFADDLTVSFTNPPASGAAGTVTLIITNGGANTTTWNAAVKWPGDNAPALTSSGVDIVSFMTIDAGTTIYGFVGGINFS